MTTTRMLFLTLALGAAFGGALVLITRLSTRGPLILIPYTLLVVVTAVCLRATGVPSFARRFGVSIGAFMIATLILFFYIILVANPAALSTPLWHKVWPLALMASIGGVLSLGIAGVSATRRLEQLSR